MRYNKQKNNCDVLFGEKTSGKKEEGKKSLAGNISRVAWIHVDREINCVLYERKKDGNVFFPGIELWGEKNYPEWNVGRDKY